MLDVCRDLDDVAGVQALCGLAFFLVPALALDADQYLAATQLAWWLCQLLRQPGSKVSLWMGR